MRPLALLLLLAAPARAAVVEPFSGPVPPGLRFEKPAQAQWQARLDDLGLSPLSPFSPAGRPLARMRLAAQLDRQQALVRLRLGGADWDLGVAGDAAFKKYYLTFTRAGLLRVAPLGDLNRLRGSGIEVQIEPGLVYRFRLSISWLNPVRGSTLEITPARGTRGPSHELNTGELVDAVKARSFVFSVDGDEYWTFYGTDVDGSTGLPGATCSLLFIHFDGLSTRAWPLAESALPLGAPARAQLLSPVTLTRDDDALTVSR